MNPRWRVHLQAYRGQPLKLDTIVECLHTSININAIWLAVAGNDKLVFVFRI